MKERAQKPALLFNDNCRPYFLGVWVAAGFVSFALSSDFSVFLTSGVVPGLTGEAFGSTTGLTTGLATGLATTTGAGVDTGLVGVLLTGVVPAQAPNVAVAAAKAVANTNLLIVFLK